MLPPIGFPADSIMYKPVKSMPSLCRVCCTPSHPPVNAVCRCNSFGSDQVEGSSGPHPPSNSGACIQGVVYAYVGAADRMIMAIHKIGPDCGEFACFIAG